MAELEALLKQLDEADAAHDADGMRKVREEIVAQHAASEEAAEAMYKIGLDLLFRERTLDGAVERFKEAAARKHPYWSAAARTSLGICLYHQGNTQKALFELRRVGYSEVPTDHSVTALSFIETIFMNDGNMEEVERVRKERVRQLYTLVEAYRGVDPSELGQHLFALGLALKDQGDDAEATRVLDEARALGPDVLGAELYQLVVDTL